MQPHLYWMDSTLGSELRWGSVSRPGAAIKGSIRVAEIVRRRNVNSEVYELNLNTLFAVNPASGKEFPTLDAAKASAIGALQLALNNALCAANELTV